MLLKSLTLSVIVLLESIAVFGQTDTAIVVLGQGAAPTQVAVTDAPNDGGEALNVSWTPTSQVGFTILKYQLLAAESAAGPFQLMAEVDSKTSEARMSSGDGWKVEPDKPYFIKVVAVDSTTLAVPDSTNPDSVTVRFEKRLRLSESAVVGPTYPIASWFNWNRLNIFLMVMLFYVLVMVMVKRAKAGQVLWFRKIAGIDAIDEAIGRATELGKPVLYVPGTQNIENIQTIASIQLLTSVATKAATYDIPIIVPLNRAFMVTVAEEAVKQGFMNAGRPDAYVRDNIRYMSDEQFAFTSGVTGIMLREKTAAHFYLGAFFAESLILSEVGFTSGAIQIAGTANTHQLPFFVVACDYTLIGEEYFATSALVTRDVEMMGTLKATDYMKAFIIVCMLASMVLELFGVQFMRSWFQVI
ncbi:MAG: fibronectin type III domain-containing protein [bacterium]|nr:fibronectin type III domain-containing protein [bacterium]